MKKILLTACVGFSLVAGQAVAQEPAPALTPKEAAALDQKVGQLISQLDNDDWAKRQAATDELVKLGASALPRLKEAFMNSFSNNEAHFRIKSILNTIVPPPPPPAPPRARFHGALNQFNPDGTLKWVDPVAATTSVLDLLSGFGVRLEATLDMLCVIDLRADTQADQMGIKVGDFLRKANKQPLAGIEDAKKVFGELAATAPLELEVRREAKTLTLKR